MRELATPRFLTHGENDEFTVPPGVGKPHLAVAPALGSIQAGHSAYFITAAELLARLR